MMRTFTRMLMLVAMLLLAASSPSAQTAADPSGHWEGTVQVPNMELKIEIDLAKDSKGKFAGTFGIPAQNVKGLPLSSSRLLLRNVTPPDSWVHRSRRPAIQKQFINSFPKDFRGSDRDPRARRSPP